MYQCISYLYPTPQRPVLEMNPTWALPGCPEQQDGSSWLGGGGADLPGDDLLATVT